MKQKENIYMEKKQWDNESRNRYYGLRIGDTVEYKGMNGQVLGQAEVFEYGFMDNNSVYLKKENGEPFKFYPEWCNIITKVEDK